MREKNLIMPVAIAAIFGGHCTLVGSTTQLTASGLLQDAAGLSFGMWDLMKVGFPATVMILLYITFAGYPMGKKIWGGEEISFPATHAVEDGRGRLGKQGALVLGIFALVIFLFVTETFSPGIVAMIGGLLCIFTGGTKQKDALARVDWNCIIWLCCCLGLGTALKTGGGAAILANALLRHFETGVPPMLFFTAMVFFAMLLSQFMSNMACLLILMPGTLTLAMNLGIAPYPVAYGMCLGAALTFATPLANGHIGMTLSAGYRFSDYLRYGLIPTALSYGMIVVLTPLWYPLI